MSVAGLILKKYWLAPVQTEKITVSGWASRAPRLIRWFWTAVEGGGGGGPGGEAGGGGGGGAGGKADSGAQSACTVAGDGPRVGGIVARVGATALYPHGNFTPALAEKGHNLHPNKSQVASPRIQVRIHTQTPSPEPPWRTALSSSCDVEARWRRLLQ